MGDPPPTSLSVHSSSNTEALAVLRRMAAECHVLAALPLALDFRQGKGWGLRGTKQKEKSEHE